MSQHIQQPLLMPSKSKAAHYTLRAIAVLNIAEFALGTWYLPYYRLTERAHINFALIVWYLFSSFALPIFVTAELIVWRKSLDRKGRDILLDAVFALAWFVVLWVSGLYSLLHTVWL